MGSNGYLPLFQTRLANGLLLFRLYAASVFIAICFICFYRLSCFPAQHAKTQGLAWIGMFLSELWFGFYFFITVVVRWNPVFHSTFKNRLSSRYVEEALPGVDIFVCTADPVLEPPAMVINTVLSVMAYDYPPEKLSVYLSDDGCSELTFYALLEAARFSQIWLPFCRKLKVEPRSPEIYFRNTADSAMAQEWLLVKKSYEDMKTRIEGIANLGKIPADIRKEHKGFREWHFVSSRRDHQSILQILIDGRDPAAMDIEGKPLPTLVYLAREKRPQCHHNFKAGALNALIRVSSSISDAPFILNVDCDMCSSNSEAIRDALCFFLDEEKGREIAYVQYPQSFDNITDNDVYGNCLRVIMELELAGFDGNGGPCYIGTGCFHRRETLCGMKYRKDFKGGWKPMENDRNTKQSASVLEQKSKALASCSFEENTQWGKEMGLKYGSSVEDILTGLSIQCRGWRSIYFNPERKEFLGVAPKTLLQYLIQHKRWSEGDFKIFLSRYCPLIYGHKRIPLKLQLSYCNYLLWAGNCLATLYYVTVQSLCLVKGILVFPKMSCPWVLSFAYAMIAGSMQSLGEFICCGGTIRGWLNEQRMWMFKRTTSYLLAFSDTMMTLFGFSKSTFVITEKVADEEISRRYEQEVMEFGTPSVMFTILATLAQLNLFSCVLGIRKVVTDDVPIKILDQFGLQMILCSVLVFMNLPIYRGLFFRKDSGKMPSSVTYQSIVYAVLACTIAMY
ncbi:hypothetical protein V6N13_148199 [Hibiscus sabdariffa]